MTISYQEAGVDIRRGDEASQILYAAARQTWANRSGRIGEVITPFDDFTGIRGIQVGGLPAGTVLGMGFDGIGTKVEVGERMAKHDTLAFDLFAMVCDDAVVRGAEPVLIGTVLDINSLGRDQENFLPWVRQMAKGYVDAAWEAGVAVINGELAELGNRVAGFGPFNYNWSAGLLWFARQERMFTGFEIRPGDHLVGLGEEGFRSNGLTLVRGVLERAWGKDWHTRIWEEKPLGEWVLKPSRIYSRVVVAMTGGFQSDPQAKVNGVAHITGGGVPGKLGRILKPQGLGARIDHPLAPGKIVSFCQELGQIPDQEAYRAWNMGQGMILVTPEPEAVIKIATAHGLEARTIGTVTSEPGIQIRSQGSFRRGEFLEFS